MAAAGVFRTRLIAIECIIKPRKTGYEGRSEDKAMSARKTRIMYIEDKSEGLNGPARIGRVTLSKSGHSVHYAGRTFQRLGGHGSKANYFDLETGDHFWISGPRKDGLDRLYVESAMPVEIDSDVEQEYWQEIRRPARA
jgi:hypothetical protein